MRYVSTRSAGFGPLPPQSFSAILLEGLAPDGGLAVPESYPRFTPAELAALRPLDYRQLPFAALSPYTDDIQAADLQAIIDVTDANIFNIAIDGVFDDCQDIVKSIAADAAFKRRFHLGAVNSINWARIAAQVVYYFKGYFAATSGDDEQVCFAVPSGNFGNVLAGHVARQMGLPIRRLLVATNENDVLDE